MAKLLLETPGIDCSIQNNCDDGAIHFAAHHNLVCVVLILLEMSGSESINSKNKFGNTPLLKACRNGSKEVALELVARSVVDVNATNTFGETALMVACSKNLSEVCVALLKRQDINYECRDMTNRRALEYAYDNKMFDVSNHIKELERIRARKIFRASWLGRTMTYVGL